MKEKKLTYTISLLLVFIHYFDIQVFSQHSNYYQFVQITVEKGLADNSINTIHQDAHGFIWIGTEYGLSRYDAYSIKNYRWSEDDTASVSDNYIKCIISDTVPGNLWIGTQNGLNYYDKTTDSFTPVVLTVNKLLQSANFDINDLILSNSYGLLAATNQGFFMQKENGFKLYQHIIHDENSPRYDDILSLHQDSHGFIWIGTRNGLDIYNPNENVFKHPLIKVDTSKPLYIYDISEDSEKNILLSTRYHGLIIFNNGNVSDISQYNKEKSDLKGNWVNTTIEESPGVYWLSIRDGGLTRLNTRNNIVYTLLPDKTEPYKTYDINSKALTSMYKDMQANLWIGTYNNGLNLLDFNKKPFRNYRVTHKEDGLQNNNIRSLFQDSDGDIWIGTKEEGGLSQFLPEKNKFIHYIKNPSDPNSINDDYVFAIEEYKKDILLVGTYRGGLNIFNKKTGKFKAYKHSPKVERSDLLNAVYSIYKDTKGRVWVGTLKNLCLFDYKSKSFSLIDSVFEVKSILQDQQGRLWFNSVKSGLLLYDENTQTFRKWQPTNAKVQTSVFNRVNHMTEDESGDIWLATGESGVFRLDIETLNLISYNDSDGLPTNQTYAIVEDNYQNMWVSMANGLARINRNTGVITSFESYDGLYDASFSRQVVLKINNGELLFGGSNGFVIFQPADMGKNIFVPPVYITGFKIANMPVDFKSQKSPIDKPIWQTKALTLKHNKSDITFEFSALNYSTPEKNKFKYKLEGFDNDWVYSGKERRAIYTNLDPGKYRFNVQASNNDGIWNEEGATLQVTILQPFWNTWVAYIIYSLAVFVILSAVYRYFKLKDDFRKNLLKERIQRKKDEELHAFKLQFFTNISHEFRTPLTLISGPLQQILALKSIDNSIRNKIEMVYKNTHTLLNQINQLMDFRKVETNNVSMNFALVNIGKLLNEQLNSFLLMAEQKHITLKMNMCAEMINAEVDIEKFKSVFFNLVSNAIKFSGNDTTISINLHSKRKIVNFTTGYTNKVIRNNSTDDNSFFEISIKDEGAGIHKEDLEKIFNRYFRVNSSKNIHIPGSGIGLAVVKSFVELHQGNIIVNSAPGTGTSFVIHFPKRVSMVLPDSEKKEIVIKDTIDYHTETLLAAEQQSEDLSDFKTTGPMHLVLIVDDNPDMIQFLEDSLSGMYAIIKAYDGVTGFQAAKAHMPDLIISDIMMPVSDGFELCEKVKSEPITSHIPVILLTAKTSVENRITGFETGADAYIAKPFDLRLLKVLIKNLIGQRTKLKEIFAKKIEVNPTEVTATSLDEIFISKALEIVEENMSNPELDTDIFCNKLGMSRTNLHNKLKAITGQSTTEFVRSIRLKRAAQLLSSGGYNVNDVVYMVGFTSPSYFTKCFKEYFQKLPNQFVKENSVKRN